MLDIDHQMSTIWAGAFCAPRVPPGGQVALVVAVGRGQQASAKPSSLHWVLQPWEVL